MKHQPQSYDHLPNGAVALINPDSDIFVSAGQTTTLAPDLALYKDIVKKAAETSAPITGRSGLPLQQNQPSPTNATTKPIDFSIKAPGPFPGIAPPD